MRNHECNHLTGIWGWGYSDRFECERFDDAADDPGMHRGGCGGVEGGTLPQVTSMGTPPPEAAEAAAGVDLDVNGEDASDARHERPQL